MLKCSHIELNNLIKGYYNKKLALFIYGAFGIGKSFVVRDTAMEIAKERAREFVNWNRLTKEEKLNVYAYPEKYFVLIDERLSEYDSSDIKGLPNFKDGQETIEWKIPFWAKFLTLPNSDGIVFFDEINLATPLVISSVYKIIYDRIVNDSKINDNWLIVGAGNRECLKGDSFILGENKRINKFKKGDSIINSIGKKTKVEEVMKRVYDGKMYNIKGRYLMPFETTAKHPLLVIPYKIKNDKKVLGKEKWIFAEQLKNDKNYMLICPKLKGINGNKRGQFISLKEFDNGQIQNRRNRLKKKGYGLGITLNKDVAWLMGLYVAEGWTNKHHLYFGLSYKEQKIADRVKQIVEKEFGFNVFQNKTSNGCITIGFSSSILSKAFGKWFGKGAINKKIPDFILFYKYPTIVYSFLRGYFLGDGCFYKKRNEISCCSISKLLIQQIQLLLIRFAVLGGISERKEGICSIRGKIYKSHKAYSYRTNNPKLIYTLGYSTKDKRKPKNEFYINQKDRILTPISKVGEKNYKGYVYNLETKNHTYLVNNCIIHNCDNAFTHTLPAPVRDRGGEVELISPNVDDWTNWASKHNVDSRIIGFVNFKPSSMSNVDFNNNQKFTTTRGLERLSCLIKGEKLGKKFELLCCSAIGEGIAKEFIAFCKIQEKLNLDDIIKNPDKIKEIDDISTKYFLVSAFAEKYKDKKIKFNVVMKASKVFDEVNNAEFVALLWRLSSSYSKDFKKDFLASKDTKFIEKYGRYLI